MKLTVLFLLFAVVASSSAFWHRRPIQSSPQFARMVLENQMHAFQNAVRYENKVLLPRLFHLAPASDEKIAEVFAVFRGYRLRVTSARVIDTNEIVGDVFMRGVNNQKAVFTLRRSVNSPTGWIIVNVQ